MRKVLTNEFEHREKHLKNLLHHHLHNQDNQLKEHEKKYLILLNEEQMQSLQREEQLTKKLELFKNAFYTYEIETNS